MSIDKILQEYINLLNQKETKLVHDLKELGFKYSLNMMAINELHEI